MKVQHSGPERVFLTALDDFVEPNQPVEVDEPVGESLLEQGWSKAKAPSTKAEWSALAEASGIEVQESWTVADIKDAIDEQTADPSADQED